ncbi:EAL domain, c-di-GMP-specific phosphodiesterase class I (or its enzymatically inactive variant) [Asanoa hainanensis]|uniref:EAL domain, c-di-GMP-specific phosphodiesterase class I (Or its enzymatically inactive variant) n=1 Tax=Asanoa hainanensis TaxID=560556 RepID=A0A239GV26_9ACTN|nr:EAL domain-containing protein [Asanoa hainanensis]SNS72980.1 EAL domain, c-di-GMP-specific phosphodiesterase class I (or its enzymatically inactive variant) [Asanoa hainanensis]
MGFEVDLPLDEEFDDIMRERLIEPVFQPVVSLVDQRPVGYEAFARGPEGRLRTPAALFAAAAEAGRAAELDELCAVLASRAFHDAGMPELALFINFNPDTLSNETEDGVTPAYAEVMGDSNVVVEITEKAVTRRPAGLLDAVGDARKRTARIALDDIGADPASLAAMPLINPDVIKLDRTIIQDTTADSHVINAVLEDAMLRGAQIVAEGVERHEHVDVARSLGATLGQGWLFGRPGPLPNAIRPSDQLLARVGPRPASHTTPYDVLARTEPVSLTSAAQLAAMSEQIENQATQAKDAAILVVNIGDLRYMAVDSLITYAYLNSRGVEVFLVGHGVPFTPGGRVRGIPLAEDDPLRDERTTLLVGTSYGSGVFARRRPGTDAFDAGTCYEWDRVVEATLPLVSRVEQI